MVPGPGDPIRSRSWWLPILVASVAAVTVILIGVTVIGEDRADDPTDEVGSVGIQTSERRDPSTLLTSTYPPPEGQWLR